MGVVDFSRGGVDVLAGYKAAPYAGVPIYYHQCESCGFVFTEAMDTFSHGDFSEKIYNEEYALNDPDYLGVRPKLHADILSQFPDWMRGNKILDYGSGLGLLEKGLRANGFLYIDSFDPFSNSFKPKDHFYDVIFAFEVFEHHPWPLQLFEEIMGYLKPNGVILFGTLTVNEAVIKGGIENWWYCTPRNGHISLYSKDALYHLARMHGFQYVTTILGDEWHVMFSDENNLWKDFLFS